MSMLIGDRIRHLRKNEGLTQKTFAEQLGVDTSYISMLEKNKNNPSEALVLSICRTWNISKTWLLKGQGDMFGVQQFTASGHAIIDEVYRRLKNYPRLHPLSEIAVFMGFNPKNPGESLDMNEEYPAAVHRLNEIFMEGDKRKIKAIMAQLEALRPEKKQ